MKRKTVHIMAPRKRVVGVQTEDESVTDQQLAAPHQGVDEDDLSPDVEKALDELGANASSVIIYRQKETKPGEWDYIARMNADEYNNEYIKEQFGGGEYKAVVIDKVQGRLNPILFSIDRRFPGKAFAGVASPVPSAGVANDPFRDRLLEVLLAKALTPAAAPAPANSTKETIELVLAVVGAVKGGDGGSSLEQMKTIFDMSKAMAEMANPPEGLAAVASNFLPVFERLVPRREIGARVSHQIAAAPKPAPVAAPVVNNPPTPPMTTEVRPPARVAGSIVPKWLEPFRQHVGRFVKIADRDSDPTLYADIAIDEIEDDEATFSAAVQAMNEDRLLTDLFAVAPEMALTEKRKEFAAQFVARVREALQDILANAESETEPETDTGAVENG